MKFSFFNVIFVISLTCLFSLQGIWLYYTYQNEKNKIQGILNNAMLNAVLGEMNERFAVISGEKVENIIPPDTSGMNFKGFSFEYEKDTKESDLASQQFVFIQKILFYEGCFFNLTKVDSIYSAELHRQNIFVQYQLHYLDSIGNIIESRGVNISKGFRTNIIPIINGTKASAIVKISSPVIFRNMLGILFVSILIFFFIIACVIYQVNILLTQNYLSQLRRNFIHTLSHDMQTPLASIHSVLTQINSGSLDSNPEIKNKFTAIAVEQTKNLQTIISQILTVAYANRKQLVLNKQEIDLPGMIRSLIDIFMVRKEKDIEFIEKYDLKDTPIYADSFYLKNAISNLIDNSIKYSGKSVTIKIECSIVNKQLYISVKDNGFGISEKDKQKIYEPFERGEEIKRKQASGFGLGLNYVKYVISAHEGSVALISREGVGSEFIITIPTSIT